MRRTEERSVESDLRRSARIPQQTEVRGQRFKGAEADTAHPRAAAGGNLLQEGSQGLVMGAGGRAGMGEGMGSQGGRRGGGGWGAGPTRRARERNHHQEELTSKPEKRQRGTGGEFNKQHFYSVVLGF